MSTSKDRKEHVDEILGNVFKILKDKKIIDISFSRDVIDYDVTDSYWIKKKAGLKTVTIKYS